jgi:nucleoside-diphosphate kinase
MKRIVAVERTLSIIKPDAVAKNVIGQIYARFEAAGLKLVAARMVHLSRAQAEGFYAVSSASVLRRSGEVHDIWSSDDSGARGENAIQKNRDLMGATDPKKAAAGTIRADFADSIDANAGMALTALLPPLSKLHSSLQAARHIHVDAG